jgi:hypothetical protein
VIQQVEHLTSKEGGREGGRQFDSQYCQKETNNKKVERRAIPRGWDHVGWGFRENLIGQYCVRGKRRHFQICYELDVKGSRVEDLVPSCGSKH